MNRPGLIPVILLLLAPLALPAAAQTLFERGYCQGPPEVGVEPTIVLMKVAGAGPRVNFIADRDKDKPKCPDLSEACKRRGFLVPGDEVLVAETRNGIACATYIAPNVRKVKDQFTETSGFLPATALVAVPTAAPRPEDWLGTWSRNAEAEIEIKKGEGGRLVITGNATYGGHDPGRVARGAINVGELEGEAVPKGNRVFFGDGYTGEKSPHDFAECQARLQLFGRYLVVEDSGGCGGVNVRFNGVYVRLK
ncbi:MAG: hypothetical protein O9322_09765 [Beijerinckiaceae bacterium]|nr:hypothetical protein [Beijerinckiaceae bacterium]MCZ8299620.1 hypothetical protein [Beijerinckiaceae bacterium]